MNEATRNDLGDTESPEPTSGKRLGSRFGANAITIVILMAIGLAAYLGWQRRESRLDREEQIARQAIESAGGLFVMDANRVHPATLNLANLNDGTLDQVVEDSQSLRYLKIYDLTGKPISDKHAGQLARLDRLTSLHMSETPIGDAGLQHLTRLNCLETLLVANTKITDAGLSHLGQMPSLVVLDLSGNDFRGDLAPLVKLPKLQWLVIRNVPLGPAALANLGAIKSLRRLTVNEGELSDEQISTLQRLNPDLSVE